jgi:Mg2+/Co2+ transporter CorC
MIINKSQVVDKIVQLLQELQEDNKSGQIVVSMEYGAVTGITIVEEIVVNQEVTH